MPLILFGDLMKKTQFTDAVRNIRKQIVSYLSIVVISMLAILTYLGISYSADNIVINGSRFYEASNFRDAQIVSTYLITQEDVDAVRAIEGVSDVEGVYRTNAKILDEDSVEDVMVVSLTQRINTPQILSGRLPENAGECVLEEPHRPGQHGQRAARAEDRLEGGAVGRHRADREPQDGIARASHPGGDPVLPGRGLGEGSRIGTGRGEGDVLPVHRKGEQVI